MLLAPAGSAGGRFEREKIQKILEAMRIASCAMNAQWLRAVVVYRDELPPETFETLKLPVTGVMQKPAPLPGRKQEVRELTRKLGLPE